MRPAPGRLPPGLRVYAVGDIHGCSDKLLRLHRRIADDAAARPAQQTRLVHLGDYVDRGPDTAGVLSRLIEAGPAIPTVNLLGNHEQMMLDAVTGGTPELFAQWLQNGGRAALKSWAIPPTVAPGALRHLIPSGPLAFLRTLDLYHCAGSYVFVHAGLRPGRTLAQQTPEDLLWIREPFLSWEGALGPGVAVHGHTPRPDPVVKSNRIGIDTGAVLGGPLTAVVLEQDQLGFLFET